jgi:hypothetical protein
MPPGRVITMTIELQHTGRIRVFSPAPFVVPRLTQRHCALADLDMPGGSRISADFPLETSMHIMPSRTGVKELLMDLPGPAKLPETEARARQGLKSYNTEVQQRHRPRATPRDLHRPLTCPRDRE